MLYRILVFIVLISTLSSCNTTALTSNAMPVQILPQPNNLQIIEGYFTLNNKSKLHVDNAFTNASSLLKTHISQLDISLEMSNQNTAQIQLKKDPSIAHHEAYELKITKNKILITASHDAGAYYAVQSLIQLLPIPNSSHNSIKVQNLFIKDQPRFAYRGMHLDVSRHMYPVAFIKKYIDAMAAYKFNNFHWHLTDDQGWRIEIKKYPKLQEIAAYRDSTLIGHYNDQPRQYHHKKYGGYYTQEEVKDVIAYAKTKHINIIPEIEIPGHAQAAIAAYPELGCTNKPVNVATEWGVFENIYCPNDATFSFLEDVLDEVAQLFPSTYIHIGGDEAPKTQWKNSNLAQEFMTKHGLKSENELQSYFIKHAEEYLAQKGKKIIGWDEILEGGLAPSATVMSWRGTQGAIHAAQQGNDVIMTPTSHCYFDYYQSDNPNEPLAIGGYLPLKKVYHFNPIPDSLSTEQQKHILGIQGNVWTEYMPTSQQVEYMAFPRMMTLSEVAWSSNANKDYSYFIQRLENHLARLDHKDIHYANHLYEVTGKFNSSHRYELNTITTGKQIRYTTDGSIPNLHSPLYKQPIPFKKDLMINAKVYKDNQALGKVFTQQLYHHKGVTASIHINTTAHPSYPGSGAQGLINGIIGSNTRYGDKEWMGYWGNDLEIEIAFNQPTNINEVQLRFYHAPGQWIYAPKTYQVYLKDNTNNTTTSIPISPTSKGVVTSKFKKDLSNKMDSINSIKFLIPNYGIIPDNQQGAGNKAWTFIDEIIIH